MTVTDVFWPLGVAAIVIAYAIHKKVVALAQPLRLEIAGIIRSLLARDDITPGMKDQVEFLRDTVFGMRVAILIGMLIAPVVLFVTAYAPRRTRLSFDADMFGKTCPPDVREAFDRLHALHWRVSFINNPILMSLLGIEIRLVGSAAFLSAVIFRQTLPNVPDAERVLTIAGTHKLRLPSWSGLQPAG